MRDFESILAGMNRDLNRYFPSHGEVVDPIFASVLSAMNEPSFAEATAETSEAYRFLWLRSFRHPIVVRVDQVGNAGTLVGKVSSGLAGPEPAQLKQNKHRALSASEFADVKASLKVARFWSLASTTDWQGLDGADWILEGYRHASGIGGLWARRTHHVVVRWSPQRDGADAPFRQACERLIALAELGADAQPVSMLNRVDRDAKAQLLAEQRERERQREEARRQELEKHQAKWRDRARAGPVCPYCRADENIRPMDLSPERQSYFICANCGRSFDGT